MPSRASWLHARVKNAVTEYRRGPWLTWPHRPIISRYASGHSSLYRCSTMPCSSQGSPGDRQRKTSSYTPSLAPIPPLRVLEEILWRRRPGISLGTPLATSLRFAADEIRAIHAAGEKSDNRSRLGRRPARARRDQRGRPPLYAGGR